MKAMTFAGRNSKEMLRDPLNVSFGLGFPVVVLLLLTAIQANIPVSLFEISRLTPGIAVFGLSFISLFSATLISRDRTTSFLTRLFTFPLTATNFILGYTLPLFPLAVGQTVVCFLVALVLKLPFSLNLFAVLAVLLPADLLFIAVGLLCGSLFNDKQVGGVCGALLTNLTALLSGTWFDLELVGGPFQSVANVLPFAHAVDAGRAALAGNWAGIFPHVWIVLAWAVGVLAAAILVFRRKMNSDN